MTKVLQLLAVWLAALQHAGCGSGAGEVLTAWAIRAGGAGSDDSSKVAALTGGDFVVGGSFSDEIVFEPGEPGETFLKTCGDPYSCNGLFFAVHRADGRRLGVSSVAGSGFLTLVDLEATRDGSFLVLGTYNGLAGFDPEGPRPALLLSQGWDDTFLARYDHLARLEWVVRVDGSGSLEPGGLAVSEDGGSVLIAVFDQEVTLGPGQPGQTILTPTPRNDNPFAGNLLLAKHAADGTLAWVRVVAEQHGCSFEDLTLGPGGSLVGAGEHDNYAPLGSYLTFDPGGKNETSIDDPSDYSVIVAGFDAAGGFSWARSAWGRYHSPMGGSDVQYSSGVSAMADGSSLVTGFFRADQVVFGRGERNETALVTAGFEDIFLARYGPRGDLIWARRAGGEGGDLAFGLDTRSEGAILVTGTYGKTATFGEGEPRETILQPYDEQDPIGGDIFVARYLPHGSLLWAKSAVGPNEDIGLDTAFLDDGSVVVVGYFNEECTFGAGEERETRLQSVGRNDAFVWRLSKGGD